MRFVRKEIWLKGFYGSQIKHELGVEILEGSNKMANEAHVKILEQGVAIWNRWRQDHPDIRPDLSRTYFQGKEFNGINLKGAKLTGIRLQQAKLNEAFLKESVLFSADLSEAQLISANMENCMCNSARFNLATMSRATLNGANFIYANMYGADLRAADLSGTMLHWADLRDADLRDTTLFNADLTGAKLIGAKMGAAKVGWTTFGNNSLDATEGLDTVAHTGPLTIGIDTIILSKGNIPESFLRGAGVPDLFITYARSLIIKPIEFYSCFISYSSKNQTFSERLYADLQSKGVRCWFAPQDLKIGEKIRIGIDESIRKHDKLLLVLSKHSVASEWVEKEVETAMEQEHHQHRTILFPVRLDNAVMQVESGWPADIRRARHIGNFTKWKNYNEYQKAFDRLLRDLRAAGA